MAGLAPQLFVDVGALNASVMVIESAEKFGLSQLHRFLDV